MPIGSHCTPLSTQSVKTSPSFYVAMVRINCVQPHLRRIALPYLVREHMVLRGSAAAATKANIDAPPSPRGLPLSAQLSLYRSQEPAITLPRIPCMRARILVNRRDVDVAPVWDQVSRLFALPPGASTRGSLFPLCAFAMAAPAAADYDNYWLSPRPCVSSPLHTSMAWEGCARRCSHSVPQWQAYAQAVSGLGLNRLRLVFEQRGRCWQREPERVEHGARGEPVSSRVLLMAVPGPPPDDWLC